jgi:Protein of unknown function (DUF2934)
MAPRRTTKAQPRQKQSPETKGRVADASRNGESAHRIAAAGNGVSPSFEQIQRRAYELFEARGGSHGRDWADWFTAELELTATSTAAL